MRCINCSSKIFKNIFKIEKQVLSSVFPLKKNELKKKYSLNLYKCTNCDLVQFKELAPLDDMYGSNYGYRTSLSPYMINHMQKKYFFIKKNLKNIKNILDIGSNDGTFLNFFRGDKSINLYGIDPSSEKFLKYYDKKINITHDYFSKDVLYGSIKKKLKFDLVTSFAMFYDLSEPNKFIKDISEILKPNGYWMVEFSYLPIFLSNLTYDQICHEHVGYYSLNVFQKMTSKFNFVVKDFSINEINGGSINILLKKVSKKTNIPIHVLNQIQKEKAQISDETFKKFQIRVDNTKTTTLELLKNLKNSKKSVIAYGASTKGNIVLNHLNINQSLIKYVCDANPEKYGRYTPGTHLKIISKKEMRKKKPDYLFLLIWSFRSEAIKQEINFLKNGGKFIVHLPSLHIIDKTNYKLYLKRDLSDFAYSA